MQDEELLEDIIVYLQDKNIKAKETFLRENKEILDLSYDDGKISDKLSDLDQELKIIIKQIKSEELDFRNMKINSESSLKKFEEVNDQFKYINYQDKNQEINFRDSDIANNNDNKNNDFIFNNSQEKLDINSFKSSHLKSNNRIDKNESNEFLDEFLKGEINDEDENNEQDLKINDEQDNLNQDKINIKERLTNKICLLKNSRQSKNQKVKDLEINNDKEPNYKPRFAVGHKLKRKNLNSSFDDMKGLDFVDNKGLEEFKLIVKEYFIYCLKQNIEKSIFTYKEIVKNGIKDTINNLKLEEWQDVFNYLLNEEENIEVSLPNKENKSSSFFSFLSCFSCKSTKNKQAKEELTFNIEYDLKLEAINLTKDARIFKSELENLIISDEKQIHENNDSIIRKEKKQINNLKLKSKKSKKDLGIIKDFDGSQFEVNYKSELSKILDLKGLKDYLENLVEEKYELIYKEQDFESFLKKEVDRFSEYFNIDAILAKQEQRLQLQKQKMAQLEEFRVLNECIICMENSRNVAFLPCLHFICCDSCAFGKINNDCPQCHGNIENKRIIII
jgi:hypothetical protein